MKLRNHLKYLTELFRKDWRDKVVMHITPKTHKLSRVKISSMPPEEQEKYNPNRYKVKRVSNSQTTKYSPEDIVNIKTIDFYVATKDVEYIYNLQPEQLILATVSSEIATNYFNEELISVKLSNVPVIATKKYISGNFKYVDSEDIDIVDIEDDNPDKILEILKFSDYKLFLIEIQPFLQYIKISIDGEELPNRDFKKLNTYEEA